MTSENASKTSSPASRNASSPADYDLEKDFPEFKGWESIGFQRPLGDEMWQYAVEIIKGAFGILTLAFFTSLLYPFPEITGYAGIAGGVFSVVYQFFDIGTNYGISRWIAEYRVRDPEKMIEYVRFFIWYQMFSGLIQITILSFVTFQFLSTSDFSYVIWLLLIGLQKQWPGMLGIFKSVIGGLQHYDKSNILDLFQSEIVQRAMNILFILAGRWYGETHPVAGMIMGMAIGAAIGGYVDDIILMFVSGHFFNKILKKVGITFRDAWRFKFGRDVVRNCVFYGAQTSIIPIINTFTTNLVFFWYVDMVPGLATWKALAGFAANFSGVIDSVGRFSLVSAIAESYSNGKKELAEFYVSYSMKWKLMFNMVFLAGVLAAFPFFSIYVMESRALRFYIPALMFVVPQLVKRILKPFLDLPNDIFNGAKFITQYSVLRVFEEIIEVFLSYLWLFVLHVQDLGVGGLIFIVVFQNYVSTIIKTVIAYTYAHKRILKIKIYWLVSVIIPFVAGVPLIIVGQAWLHTGFYPMMSVLGIELTAVVSLLLMVPIGLFTFFPLTAILGGWDDYQLFTFRKGVELSGPSKPIFKLVYKLLEMSCAVGRKIGTHGRFRIPHELAHQQIRELLELKRTSMFKKPAGPPVKGAPWLKDTKYDYTPSAGPGKN